MDQNNKEPQYRGTRGLSLAIVIGVAIGTVIGKLMDNMNTGLMMGLVIGVCAWVLLFKRKPGDPAGEDPDTAPKAPAENVSGEQGSAQQAADQEKAE